MLFHRYKDVNETYEVIMDDGVLKQLLAWSVGSKRLETGGVLAGYYNDELNKAIIIQGSDAPKDSKHMRYRFYRGVIGLQEWLEMIWEKEKAYYLGEWHFHPYASSRMSSTDDKQMCHIARDISYHCPEPLLLIIGGNPSKEYSISVNIFRNNGKNVELNIYSSEII
ncbi:Mov34/MPN/PAD-1 family protein [Paenibacillus taichungensis]|uniref:Mov34/MPN/PAD-1 family protein n=1 Tax=Paenibacillus taichungensis TaxID=484184 RepID=UPI002871A9E7|nr:Mov34/MPN/PAD-1 family protein [Paenibacillus taichungensis]MDR9748536.1 Mov34/MPN/PAD-1 family protein [Paenibacillus taichungensis]